MQHAARDLQPGQPHARIITNFEHTRAEFRPPGRGAGQRLQAAQQPVQPVQPQRRAEKHREHLPPRNSGLYRFCRCCAGLKHLVHQRLAAQSQRLRVGRGGKIHAPVPEPPAQLPQAHGGVRAGQIHLVDKQEGGHAVALQQLALGNEVFHSHLPSVTLLRYHNSITLLRCQAQILAQAGAPAHRLSQGSTQGLPKPD